jgi:preprotein translocase subunit SecB
MAKNSEPAPDSGSSPAPSAPAAGGSETLTEASQLSRLPIMIHAQYIKDLSIENPNAPQSFKVGVGRPTLDVNFTMDAQKIKDEGPGNLFEVTLGIEATARKDDQVAFIIELQYAVLVSLNNVPEDQAHPLLLIEMPRYAFPFARQIIADATQQAGFTPLLLTPVDFREFYLQRYGQQQGAPEAAKTKTA